MFMKIQKMNKIKFHVLPLVLLFALFGSCVEDVTESTKEPTRYASSEINSYSDLFDMFWNTMNQKYNYFNEQKGMDWEAVYKEYAPKFKELKTWKREPEYSKAEISEDCEKAEEYFTDIIDPIIDRHFYVKISLPASHSYIKTITFYGGMKNKETIYTYPFEYKYAYMQPKIKDGTGVYGGNKDVLGGFLQDNPDIYYFGFSSFMLSNNYMMSFRDEYLAIDENSPYFLSEQEIRDTVAVIGIEEEATRQALIERSVEVVRKFDSFMKSEPALTAASRMKEFERTENMDETFIGALTWARKKAPDINSVLGIMSQMPEFSEHAEYTEWFTTRLMEHLQLASEYTIFLSDVDKVLNSPYIVEFYNNFITPLKEGKIKKIILDFRGNGGGLVVDARTFTDRFITKNVVFGYQRFKEDNNPYSYTPWVPCMTKVTDIGIREEIPIVVLIDRYSASMSEISTLMLKSQGKHVTVVGSYSAGATAGLGDSDQFNGGLVETIGGCMEFYMPLIAMQDASRTIIESIGIKPDIIVELPTEEEVYEMALSPKTHVDRTFEQAVELLDGK